MKKHMPGFVPVNFKKSGIFLLIISLACLIAKLISYLTNWFNLPNSFIYFGTALIILSLYLIFTTPKK